MHNLLSIPTLVAIGGLNVALVDLIVLAVILASVLIGALKGFVNQIFSILGGLAALIIAVIFCAKVSDLISTAIPSIPQAIADKLNEMLGLSGVVNEGAKEQILESLKTTTIPAFLHDIIADLIVKVGVELELDKLISGWVLTGICFVTIFILSLILFAVLKKLFKKLLSNKVFGKIDRVLGAIFSALKSIIIIIAVCILLSIIFDLNSLLTPTAENGQQINSVVNAFMTWLMNLQFIKNLLII